MEVHHFPKLESISLVAALFSFQNQESSMRVTRTTAREVLDYGLLGEVVEHPDKPSIRIKRQGHPPDVKDAFSALQTGSTRNRK